MRTRSGFTLVELVASVVVMGIIAVFGGYFMATGMRSELAARQAAIVGQKAELALERIAVELRDATGATGAGTAIAVQASPARIRYTSTVAALGGNRVLLHDADNFRITLTPASGAPQVLIDNVTSCSMSFSGTGAASVLTVRFTLRDVPTPFSITLKPRTNTLTPVNG